MEPKTKQSHESIVKEIKRNTRRKFNSEEKIRIILEGLRGEDSIASICRKEGIAPSIYYKVIILMTCRQILVPHIKLELSFFDYFRLKESTFAKNLQCSLTGSMIYSRSLHLPFR
jgi:transposase-like protein